MDGYRSVFAPGLFLKRTVIVTGGGSGIGRCTAHELASLGAHVVLVGRKVEKLDAVVAEIAEDGGEASRFACDIRDEAAVREMVASTVKQRGRIDGLVNNAGGQFLAPLESISTRGWEAVIASNLTGGFLVSRECYTQSMRDHGGVIVNIVADFWGSMPGMGHSGAARAGMVSLTETAAAEWAKSGVRVNAVAPGYIASSGMNSYPTDVSAMVRELTSTIPLGRFGLEAEVSSAICFLLSPAANFISGATLRVDGARPQVRMGWPIGQPEAPSSDSVDPYSGFHRYEPPAAFRKPT